MSMIRNVKLRKAQKAMNSHCLQISKEAFYKNFFDVEGNEILHIDETICVVFSSDKRVLAFRDGDKFLEVDTYKKTL